MRITPAAVEQLRSRLTPVDWAVVETLEQVSIATAGQLRRLHWPEPSQARTARRRLAWLSDQRIIARLDRRVGGVRAGSDGYVYRLDVAGRRLLGHNPGRRPHTPGRLFLDHAIAVTETLVALTETAHQSGAEIVSFDTEPACWRTWATGILKPDAYLVTAGGEFEDHSFLEIDRATESTTTIARKASVYERYHQTGIEQQHLGIFPRVVWIVPTDRRKNQLVETLSQRPAQHWKLHQVLRSDEIDRLIT